MKPLRPVAIVAPFCSGAPTHPCGSKQPMAKLKQLSCAGSSQDSVSTGCRHRENTVFNVVVA